MNGLSLLYFLIIVTFTVIMFLLPFLPAWLEWKNKTDAEPFEVYFEDRTLVDYLIRMFKKFIEGHFSELIEKCEKHHLMEEGVLENKTEYYIAGKEQTLTLSAQELDKHKTNKVIIFCEKGVLPKGVTFTNRIFAKKELMISEHCVVNEVMSQSDLIIEKEVLVQKLLLSENNVIIHEHCDLYGYVRAENKIQFLGNSKFQYLNSKTIEFGKSTVASTEKTVDVMGKEIPRLLTGDDINIPEFSNKVHYYVSKRSIHVGKNTKIIGSLKASRGIHIETNTQVVGALFCERDITIEDNCIIQGPVVSNGVIQLGKNCMIGAMDSNTSLIGRRIYILSGCLVKGMVLAKIEGNYSE